MDAWMLGTRTVALSEHDPRQRNAAAERATHCWVRMVKECAIRESGAQLSMTSFSQKDKDGGSKASSPEIRVPVVIFIRYVSSGV